MSFIATLLLALGLGLDTAAVSAVRGARDARWGGALAAALLFGAFHWLMPVLGWFLGRGILPWIEPWDHWLASAVLAGIGGKLLHEAFTGHGVAREPGARDSLHVTLALAFATSVDALVIGVMLPLLDAPIGRTAATIGVVAALASLAGHQVGRSFGARFGRRFDVVGGLVLIGLGVKILVEHLTAA
ncbi:MAG: manganese efflux pump [Planctomycetes bacterium]|nr:manganese efflux pump [Planctomycetota bacterium]